MCGVQWMMALTALQGIQQYNQVKQQTAAQVAVNNQQAELARQNAKTSEARQSQIAEKYANDQRKLDDRMRLMAGQAAAQAGGSGLTLSGSPLDVLMSGYGAYQDDSTQLLQNQRNDVRSEYINEVNYRNQASTYNAAAANARAQGKTAALGTILSTASSLWGIHNSYKGANAPAQVAGGTFTYPTDLLNAGKARQLGIFGNTFKYNGNIFGTKNIKWGT